MSRNISQNQLRANYQQVINTADDPTHEYFNMGCFNEYTPNNTLPKPLVFNQVKQYNVVDKADDYYLSIVRWNLQSNLPVLIPDIQIKSTKELFTNVTDYELALLYSTEVSTLLTNTFGLVSAGGNNYLGQYEGGEYGFEKQISINFVPDNNACVAYDNFNNAQDPTVANGSIYIISGGVLKVFDKVSNTVLLTLTPAAGYAYKFVATNKTTGDFYVGYYTISSGSIQYNQYLRTGSTTWSNGSNYTSLSNVVDVGGICFDGTSLYEISQYSLYDEILATNTSNVLYNVNENVQESQGAYSSSMAITSNGFAFGAGTDNNTYGFNYPPTSLPAATFTVNNTNQIKTIWSKYNQNTIYASASASNIFYGLNASIPFSGYSVNNAWHSLGEIEFTFPSTITPISTDVQTSTNKLLSVGSDNNLYITQNPVGAIELTLTDGNGNGEGYTFGIDLLNTQGLAQSYLVTNAFGYGGFPYGIFKRGENYYVAQPNNTGTFDLQGYLITDYSQTLNLTNFDSVIYGLTYLPNNSLYVYNNASDIKFCSVVSNTPTYTYAIPTTNFFQNFYELDSNFCAAANNQTNNIYVYKIDTGLVFTYTVSSATGIEDICVNESDKTNGANTLFVLCQDGTIRKLTFTDNTYTAINTDSLLYTPPSGRNVTFLDCHQSTKSLRFIESDNGTTNNRTFKVLFQNGGYQDVNQPSPFSIPAQSSGNFPPRKPYAYMPQSTTSTWRWTQITSNIQLNSISISKNNENNIYAINNADNLIYQGLLSGGSIVFNKINVLSNNTYEQISNGPIQPYAYNNVSKWNAGGTPTTQSIISSNPRSTSYHSSSIITDGTSLYALYDNHNNQTTLNKLNNSLASLLTNNVTFNILNGLVGFDENNNLAISNSVSGVNKLAGYSTATLSEVYNNNDPLNDYSSSTQSIYPFTQYSVQTVYNLASDGCINLLFIPEIINTNYASLLTYPQDKEQLFSNPYFYIRYVDTLCRMINVAIKDAFDTVLNGQWNTLPFFEWNSVEGKIVYNQPNSNPTGTPAPVGAKWFVAVNQPLYNLLNTFRFKYFPQNSGNGSIYPESIDCRYLLDTNILFDNQAQPTGQYTQYIQQISSVQTWTPVQSLVFISTIIPLESQLTGQPQNLNTIDPTTASSVYKQQALTKILTDYIIPLTSGVELTNQVIDFSNAGEYRLVDLLGSNSLNQLSFEVNWKDKYGVLHPLTIDAGANADLLCMLRRKAYNSKF